MKYKCGIIYKVVSPSGKVYIGKTATTLERRKSKHYSVAFNSYASGYNYSISKAIRKYKEELSWDILEDNVPVHRLNELEVAYIIKFDSFNSGYNSTVGGEGCYGYTHSAASRLKMSKAHLGQGGEKCPASKLNWRMVNKIRRMYTTREYSQKHLASQFKINRRTVGRIVKNETWYDENYTAVVFNINHSINVDVANEIRSRYNNGHYTHKELADKYGVSRRTIGNIINNKVWDNE